MFLCTKCGLCCRNIDKIPELADFHAGDGESSHFVIEHCLRIGRRTNDMSAGVADGNRASFRKLPEHQLKKALISKCRVCIDPGNV